MSVAARMPKALKIVLLTLLGLFLFILVVVIAYVIYVSASYYRIGDKDLSIKNNTEVAFSGTDEYSILTYNIGFGAYTPEFSFFMDGGKDSVAKSKAVVEKNTEGAAKIASALGVDFALFQETDTDSTRSKKVNQYNYINEILNNNVSYGSVFADNFHSPFLFYPIFKPHGVANSGLATFSKFKLNDTAKRVELPVTKKWPTKLFDLDRCYSEVRMPVGGHEFVLINIHLTAYDKGGTVRAAQLQSLKDMLTREKEAGNYVIMGGDFNHDLISTFGGNPEEYFTFTKPDEDWVQTLPEDFTSFLTEQDYSVRYGTNAPSCRSTAYSYKENVSRVWAIDGFIVSGNIDVTDIKTIDKNTVSDYDNFIYSDHNPVLMKFRMQ